MSSHNGQALKGLRATRHQLGALIGQADAAIEEVQALDRDAADLSNDGLKRRVASIKARKIRGLPADWDGSVTPKDYDPE